MKSRADGFTANEMMFSGGVRGQLHTARFRWFTHEILERKMPFDTVLEIGCFDGKLINFLPSFPSRYVGYDKNWGGGLDLAAEKWKSHPNFSFYNISAPQDISLTDQDQFDIAVAMETFEHLSLEAVRGYLKKIEQHLNGFIFVTIPNEMGVIFLAKWLTKRLLSKDSAPYTFAEVVNATLGRMSLVARREHKGFDYRTVIQEVGKYFDVLDVTGLPFKFLPLSLSFQIGILARSKP
jgi:2-polyprenyl-3-methyl-5-hydroxy-6-metoxy-1,4-benzoquinol methylase